MSKDQFAELLQAVEKAVQVAVGREAYTLSEAAEIVGFSPSHMYREVERGALVVVRPGGGKHARVMREHLLLWLWGQRKPGDAPSVGLIHQIRK